MSVKNLQEFGNSIAINFDDGSRILAYPTTGGFWIPAAAQNGAPSPGDGFRWPFNPADIGTEWEEYLGHKGVDWPKADGTPIIAANHGTVEYSGWYPIGGVGNPDWSNWGNMVVINHGATAGNTLRTLYAHMNATPLVNVNDTVTKGQVIGYVGTTGLSSGDHLHWETSVNGMFNQINPRTFMASYGE